MKLVAFLTCPAQGFRTNNGQHCKLNSFTSAVGRDPDSTDQIKSPLDGRTYDPSAYVEHIGQHSDAVWVDEEDWVEEEDRVRSVLPEGRSRENAVRDEGAKVEWEEWHPDLAVPPEDPERSKK